MEYKNISEYVFIRLTAWYIAGIDKHEYIDQLESKKSWTSPVQIVVDRYENPILENVLICDMFIKVKTGGSRTIDRVYAQSKLYYKYLRYGLSFLEFYNSENTELCEKIELIRKGLMRVFELKIDYLIQDFDCILGKIISQKDFNIRNYILGEAFSVLERNYSQRQKVEAAPLEVIKENCETDHNLIQIELCHYVQTDGINAQISWCPSVKCWVIGSFNVSIILQNLDDLK